MYWNERTFPFLVFPVTGLIETWDVLKYNTYVDSKHCTNRLIETWDVLKFNYLLLLLF